MTAIFGSKNRVKSTTDIEKKDRIIKSKIAEIETVKIEIHALKSIYYQSFEFIFIHHYSTPLLIFRPSIGPTYEVYDLNSGHDQSMLLLRNEVQGLQSSAAPWEIRMFLKLFAPALCGASQATKGQ